MAKIERGEEDIEFELLKIKSKILTEQNSELKRELEALKNRQVFQQGLEYSDKLSA